MDGTPNNPNNPNRRQIKVEMPRDPSAIYTNTIMISSTANEMIFDLLQVLPHDHRARIQQRVVMTPASAKMLLGVLSQQIKRYEDKFGEITPRQPGSLADALFRDVAGGGDDDDE